MLGEYRKATEFLERASALTPGNAECFLWLGRAYGRRAETSNPFSAPGYASKARQMFERAVSLDPTNREAIGDLFDYYLGAPGFLGGGANKAEALAARVAQRDPAEGHYYQAQLDEHRKQYDSAEQHLRTAVELAPRQASRLIDLAKYLANRGKTKESDALFEQAERIAPQNPRVIFERASTYVKTGRNLDEARKLLRRYLQAPITPNDPPKSEAEALLRKSGPDVPRRSASLQLSGAPSQQISSLSDRAGPGDRECFRDPGGHYFAHQPRLYFGPDPAHRIQPYLRAV